MGEALSSPYDCKSMTGILLGAISVPSLIAMIDAPAKVRDVYRLSAICHLSSVISFQPKARMTLAGILAFK
jgi:hypothetical protein